MYICTRGKINLTFFLVAIKDITFIRWLLTYNCNFFALNVHTSWGLESESKKKTRCKYAKMQIWENLAYNRDVFLIKKLRF